MSKAKKLLQKKSFWIFLAFLLPVAVFGFTLTIFAAINGSATLTFTDAGAQYIDFLAYYKSVWAGEASAKFSLSGGLGTEVAPLFSYYLMSPFNLLVLLFPLDALPYVFYALVLIRIGLMGTTAFLFLDSYRKKESRFITLVFATTYALCGFLALYFWNIMWLDAMVLLPLVALGINRLVKDGKIWIYVLALGFSIIFNYYTGWMLGIFSIMWFAFQMFLQQPQDKKRKITTFIIATTCAVLMAGFVLLPTALFMLGGSGNRHVFLENFLPTPRFFITDLFGQLTTGAFNGENHYIDGLPNIFIGVIATVFLVLFFMNKKIDRREKIGSTAVLLILFLSMWVKSFNSIWHGFAIEFWFPTRYAFIVCFFLIYLAYREVQNFTKISRKQVVILALIFLAILLCSLRVNQEKIIVLISDAMIFGLTVFLLSKSKKRTLTLLTLGMLQIVNLGANLYLSFSYLTSEWQWQPNDIHAFYQEVEPAIRRLKEYDNSFYRVEKTFARSDNDAMALNYRGLSQFSSTANLKVLNLMEQLGYEKPDATKLSYVFEKTTLTTDGFFGIKYLISDQELEAPLELVFEENDLKVYRNPYALGIGMIIPEDFDVTEGHFEQLSADSVAIKATSKDDHIFAQAEVAKEKSKLLFTIADAPGWEAFVDGEKVEIEQAFGALIAIPLEIGEHEIELKFSAPGAPFLP